jgi:hypothetical protein
MAEVPSPDGGTMFKTKVTKDGTTYEVSTVDTFDAGWETLVFKEGGSYVYTTVEDRYRDYREAKEGHEVAVRRLQTENVFPPPPSEDTERVAALDAAVREFLTD